jgi:hypothetical protein
VEVSTDGEEEEIGDQEGGDAVVQQVGKPDLEKGLHLKWINCKIRHNGLKLTF